MIKVQGHEKSVSAGTKFDETKGPNVSDCLLNCFEVLRISLKKRITRFSTLLITKKNSAWAPCEQDKTVLHNFRKDNREERQ